MYLTSVSVLLILWMTSRTAKYFIFWQPAAIRYLWYLFYLPMLFVPMLAVLIALSLGKPDGYRLPKSTWILWAVSGVLLLLVLTNDLHQLVFTFPADAAVWSDTDNGYAAGYFVVTGWQVLCAAAALVTMFFKCPVPNGLLLHTMPVNGGYAVWTEDVSALLAVKEASESLAEELKERNALLRYEYKRDARRCMIEEQNRLYDLLQSATQLADRIAVLTKDYQKLSETDPSEAQKRLSEIAVLCSYIKRRKHLTLLADRDYKVAVTELERAFSESLQTLKLPTCIHCTRKPSS